MHIHRLEQKYAVSKQETALLGKDLDGYIAEIITRMSRNIAEQIIEKGLYSLTHEYEFNDDSYVIKMEVAVGSHER